MVIYEALLDLLLSYILLTSRVQYNLIFDCQLLF